MYADITYYIEDYKGTLTDPSEIEKLLKKANRKIDEVTFNRIVELGVENLSEFQQNLVKEAVCYQADYINENGSEGFTVASYSVLGISINYNQQTESEKLDISADAYNNLKQTGLMCRVV